MKKLMLRINKIPYNIKAAAIFTFCSFFSSGINYIFTPIFTRLLSTIEYGIVAKYNSWYTIVQVFASMTLIYPGIINVGLYEHKNNKYEYLSSMLGITFISTSTLLLIYLLFSKQILQIVGLSKSLISLLFLSCYVCPAYTFWLFKNKYELEYKTTLYVSICSSLLSQLISVLCIVIFKDSNYNLAEIKLWSAGLINVLISIFLYVLICKNGKSFTNLIEWKKYIIIAIPLIPHYLSNSLFHNSDKIMISKMIGDDKTGIYSLVATFSTIGVLLWRALKTVYVPYINEKLGSKKYDGIKETMKPLLIYVAAFCIATSLLAPEILQLVATKEYIEGVSIMPPIAISVYIHAIYDNYSSISFFYKKSSGIALSTTCSALINIILNYIFIRKFGYLAAGYTTLISNLLLTILHYINSKKCIRDDVFDDKFNSLSILLVTVSSLLCNCLYSLYIIRYIILIIIIIFMWLHRKKLFDSLINMDIN